MNAYAESAKKRKSEQKTIEEKAVMKTKKEQKKKALCLSLSVEDRKILEDYSTKRGQSLAATIHQLIRDNLI